MTGPRVRTQRAMWPAQAVIRCICPKIRCDLQPRRLKSVPRVIKRSTPISSNPRIIRCARARWPAPPAIRRMARPHQHNWSRTPSRKPARLVMRNSVGRFSGSTSPSRRTAPTATIRTDRHNRRCSRSAHRFSVRRAMRAQVIPPSRVRRRVCRAETRAPIYSPVAASIVIPKFTAPTAPRAAR